MHKAGTLESGPKGLIGFIQNPKTHESSQESRKREKFPCRGKVWYAEGHQNMNSRTKCQAQFYPGPCTCQSYLGYRFVLKCVKFDAFFEPGGAFAGTWTLWRSSKGPSACPRGVWEGLEGFPEAKPRFFGDPKIRVWMENPHFWTSPKWVQF